MIIFNVCQSGGTALRLRGNNTDEHGIVNRSAAGNMTTLFNFTVSFWVNPKQSSKYQDPKAILSYAYADKVSNGLLISRLRDGKLRITFTPRSKIREKKINRYSNRF